MMQVRPTLCPGGLACDPPGVLSGFIVTKALLSGLLPDILKGYCGIVALMSSDVIAMQGHIASIPAASPFGGNMQKRGVVTTPK